MIRPQSPKDHKMKRTISEPLKKLVAYRQQWTCSACKILLPPSYQIDHTTPLCDGGSDTLDNVTAMCPTCHANKTQVEALQRSVKSRSKQQLYDEREDVRVKHGWICSSCGNTRPYHARHDYCVGIEDPSFRTRGIVQNLSRFRFSKRTVPS